MVLQHLTQALEALCRLGVGKIVIACVTSHHFVPKLPLSLQQKIISLVDIIFTEVINAKRRQLLLCTNGVRQTRLFENDKRWELIQEWMVLPSPEDQCRIHDFIYRLKAKALDDSTLDELMAIISRYKTDSFVAGCTELHLVARHLKASPAQNSCDFVDPLFSIAKNLNSFLYE